MKLKSKSNAKNKITATARLASPVFRYTLVQLIFESKRNKKKNRRATELLTMYKIHHPNGDIHRLYGNKERRNKRLVTH